MIRLCVFIALYVFAAAQAGAHEMRPAYLEIQEVAAATYSVLWKVPMRGDMRLQLDPQFPDTCKEAIPPAAHSAGGALITRWTVKCESGLADQRVSIAGLENTLTDVLARVQQSNWFAIFLEYDSIVITSKPLPHTITKLRNCHWIAMAFVPDELMIPLGKNIQVSFSSNMIFHFGART